MLHRRWTILTAVAGMLALTAAAQASSIPWRTSVQDALAEAQKGDKLVMISFSDSDCEWCDRMDKETLSDASVVTACQGVVPVRIDVGKDPDTAKKYDLEGVPTFVFVEANGDEARRIVGYVPAPDFVERLNDVLKEEGQVVSLRKRIADEPSNDDAKAELARILIDRRQGDQAAPLVDALAALPKEKAPKDMADLLLNTGIAYGSRGNNDRALVYMDKVIQAYPGTEQAEWAGFFTGLALGLKGDRDGAIKQLEKVVATAKNEAIRERAQILIERFKEQAPATSPSL